MIITHMKQLIFLSIILVLLTACGAPIQNSHIKDIPNKFRDIQPVSLEVTTEQSWQNSGIEEILCLL